MDKLQRLSALAAHFQDRKRRAGERATKALRGHWHFALVSFTAEFDSYSLGELGTINKVIEPPGEVELAGALQNPSIFGAIARYSDRITFELSVDERIVGSAENAFTHAWLLISCIRLISRADFLVPAAADRSWSTIAGIDDNTCHARLVEDFPLARVPPQNNVTPDSLRWVRDNFESYVTLSSTPSFQVASSSLSNHHLLSNERAIVASLWSGLEAMLAVQQELRFRISVYLAAYLEPLGDSRLDLFKRLLKLYDFRSKVVHGLAATKSEIENHISEVRAILSRLLIATVERRSMPSQEIFEDHLFRANEGA